MHFLECEVRFFCVWSQVDKDIKAFLGYRRPSGYGRLVVCRVVRVECREVTGNMAMCMGLN